MNQTQKGLEQKVESEKVVIDKASKPAQALEKEKTEIALPEFAPEGFEPHFKSGMSIEDYHADPSSVSSSRLKKTLQSPLHFLLNSHKETPAMSDGTLVHSAILEPELMEKNMVVKPDISRDWMDLHGLKNEKVKDYKDKWAVDQGPDAIILTKPQRDMVLGVIRSMQKNKEARYLISDGTAELSGFARDPITGLKVRVRLDYLRKDGMVIDVKKSSKEEDFYSDTSPSIGNYMYHLSAAMYLDVGSIILSHTTKQDIRLENFVFLFVEPTPPYCVVPRVMDFGTHELGQNLYHLAIRRTANAIKTKAFPGYDSQMKPIAATYWHFQQMERRFDEDLEALQS